MSSVDDRVVNMKFNNSTFVSGVTKTIGVLANLKKSLDLSQAARGLTGSLSSVDRMKKSLDFTQSTKSLNNLETAASRFQLGNMGVVVQGVSKRLAVMGTIGVAALAHITTRAIDAGTALTKALTITPVLAGLENYETKIGSIQTILANTKAAGTKLSDVTAVLAELNEYANKTIYNFSEMTRNIGTFTAAGVDLKTATSSIKGIANLAALSGSNSQQASTAMYQLSQAISAGQVHLQDWNSVVNAGMGGTVFQRALAQTAVAMGTLNKNAVKLKGPMKNVTIQGNAFRQSLTPPPGGTSWLTSKVLTTALSTFTGDLSKGQLAAMGFKKAQIEAIQAQAKTAVKAATQIKTISQMNQALKEEVASSWSNVWETLIGDFKEAPKLLTPLHNTLQNLFQAPAVDLNKLLKAWKRLGGRNVLILGIKQAFEDLARVIKPIHEAFRDIFPAKTGRDLYNATVAFANFMQRITIGSDTAENLKRTFAGVFAIFDIGKQVVSAIFGAFSHLFTLFHDSTGSFSAFTGNIGDWIVALDRALKKGNQLKQFFNNLADLAAGPIHALGRLGNAITHMFDSIGGHGGTDHANTAFSVINAGLQKLSQGFNWLFGVIHKGFAIVGKIFAGAGHILMNSFSQGNFNTVLHLINTVFFGGIFLAFKKFTENIASSVKNVTGLIGSVKGVFGEITNTLKTMQEEVKSQIILNIAKAVGILILSVVALTLINPDRMNTALKGLAAGFAELIGAVAILGHIEGKFGAAKVPAIASGLILLAGAITILATSVIALSLIPTDKLEKGVTAVGALLGFLATAGVVLRKSSVFLPIVAAGMIGIATAITTLTLSVVALSFLSWKSLIKGLAGIAGILGAVALGVKLLPAFKLITIGIGLNEIAVALGAFSISLGLLTAAIFAISRMSWKSLAKGLTTIGIALAAMTIALKKMPKDMLLKVAALDALSAALVVMSVAVGKMGGLSLGQLAKGLGGLAASMLILAVGLKAMKGTLAGAAAMTVASGALYGLALALSLIGNLSIKTLIIGLAGIAAVFGVIAVAGRLLTGAIPGLVGFGLAIAAIGVGVSLVGFGINEFAEALSTLAKSGTAGLKVLMDGVTKFITLIPDLVTAFAKAIIDFLKVLSSNGPEIVKGLASLLEDLMQAIIKELPTALRLFTKLIHTLLQAIRDNLPDIIDAALDMIVKFLRAVAKKMPDIVDAGANVVVNFILGIGKNIGKLIDAGFQFIVDFLNGLADAIDKHEEDIIKAGFRIGWAIITGLWRGIKDLFKWLWGKIENFFTGLWGRIKGFFGISSPSKLAAELGGNIIKGLWSGIQNLTKWLGRNIVHFFTGLWNDVVDVFKDVGTLGKSIITKLWNGISGAGQWIATKVTGLAKGLWNDISGVFSGAATLGKRLVSNLWSGISQGGVWLALKLIGWVQGIWSAFTGLISSAADLGGNIVNAIWEGIKNLGGWLKDKVTGMLSDLWGGVTDFLGIGSPSKLFMSAGELMMKGWGIGIDNNQHHVKEALNQVSKTIQNHIADKVNSSIETSPRISPVLDLTQVQKDASKIAGYLGGSSIDSTVSFRSARDISAREQDRHIQIDLAQQRKDEPRQLIFKQENNSPKPLDQVRIYRQTKTLLSSALEALES